MNGEAKSRKTITTAERLKEVQRELKKVKQSRDELRGKLEQARRELDKREALWVDVSRQHRENKLKLETQIKTLFEGAGPDGKNLLRLGHFEWWFNSILDSSPGRPVNSSHIVESKSQQRQAERQVQPALPTVHEGRASAVAARHNQAARTNQQVRFQTLSQVPGETFTPARRSHGDSASMSSAVSRSTMNDGRDRVLGMAL